MGLNFRAISKYLGLVVLLLGGAMVIPTVMALCIGETDCVRAFGLCGAAIAVLGGIFFLPQRHYNPNFHAGVREGFFIMAVSWIIIVLLGGIPYSVAGVTEGFIDSIFESASGFTTTSSTTFDSIESLPRSIIFWRAFTSWIGAVLTLAFLTMLAPEARMLNDGITYAEKTRATFNKLSAFINEDMPFILAAFTGITLLAAVLLRFCGMSWFDAFVHGISTCSTGGFSSYDAGLAHFGSTAVYLVVTLFMLISGLNFYMYYIVGHRGPKPLFRDPEFERYVIIIALSILLIMMDIHLSQIYPVSDTGTLAAVFQTVSAISTTGFRSFDISMWPTFSLTIIFLLMLCGSCMCSAGGGLKILRVSVLIKILTYNVSLKIHPHAILDIKYKKKAFPQQTASAFANFVFIYITVFVIGCFLLALDGAEFIRSISTTASCLANNGISFDPLVSHLGYNIFSGYGKLVLSGLMLAGRLEVFPLLMLISRRFWNPSHY